MFEQALVESARHLPGARRTYSAAASLLLQTAALATLFVVPVLTTQVAPRVQDRLAVFLPKLTPAPVIESSGLQSGSATSSAATLRQPRFINRLDPTSPELETPLSLKPVGIGKPGPSIPDIFGSHGSQVALNAAETQRPPISVLEAGVVLSRIQPIYPRLAIASRVQGTVHLNALIAPNGTLQDLRVISGHPWLAQAAKEAVEQWKFRPYVLNGKPIEVQTEVIVNFSLN